MRHNLSNVLCDLSRSFAQLLDPYRPELHYMRGPGPKWHAKRAGIAAKTAPLARGVIAARRRLAKAHA